jgi:hypothetical protein
MRAPAPHLLKELKACSEDGHPWTKELAVTLVAMKVACEEALKSESPRLIKRQREEPEAATTDGLQQACCPTPLWRKRG